MSLLPVCRISFSIASEALQMALCKLDYIIIIIIIIYFFKPSVSMFPREVWKN